VVHTRPARGRQGKSALGSTEVFEEIVLVTTPLPNGQGAVALAKERCDHTDQHKGQFRASSMLGAGIRNGCQQLIVACA